MKQMVIGLISGIVWLHLGSYTSLVFAIPIYPHFLGRKKYCSAEHGKLEFP